MISLGGGMPNPNHFPINGLSFHLKDGTAKSVSEDLLKKALQYSSSYGLPELIDWLKKYQIQEHQYNTVYPNNEWEICVTTGSQDALSKTFDLLLDEDDHILVENPTYSGAIGALLPIGCHLVGIETDNFGMIPNSLKKVLSTWDFNKNKLKTVYLIPNGQNPSGSSLTEERKKEIYQLVSEYNLLLLEDDPYYNLVLPKKGETTVTKNKTFASMDTDGRVLRFDSFSKIISSGMRVGWVTGPKPLIEKLQLDQQVSELHSSGLSQAILVEILNSWGKEGFDHQLEAIRHEYTKRRDVIIEACEKYLVGLAEWEVPTAGMFLWLKLIGVADTTELIKVKAVKELVLMVPGKSFSPNGEDSPYVRAAFSTASLGDIDDAIRRLSLLLKSI